MSEIILSEKNAELLNKAIVQYELKDKADNLSAKSQRVFIASQMTVKDIGPAARMADESYEAYKERQKIENLWLKMSLQGNMVWKSVDLTYDDNFGMYMNNGGGTYEKAKHGFLTEWDEKKAKKLAARKIKNEAKRLGVYKGK